MKNEKLKEIIKHQKNIINNLENKLDFQKSENYKLENKILKAIELINNYDLEENLKEILTNTLKGSDKQ